MTLRLGRGSFSDTDLLVMAIVNRTPDSFFDKGASWADDAAMERVHQVVAEGADIIDIGGVKAGPGEYVSPEEEARRVVPFVAAVRDAYPEIVISVDTWRHEVGRAACEAGADLMNDAWGGVDPLLAEVAAEFSAGIICTHTGGATPRTRPHRVAYDDLMLDIITRTTSLAECALAAGVPRESIVIDPGHDFGKNTWHSLEATRRTKELVDTGWPVLVSTSNKDFIGESLDRPVDQRLLGSLTSVAITAFEGARIFRVHAVAETREVLDMVASIAGTRSPASTTRGLA
ncbi:MAG: dihydropteroate synthase [Actinomycetota bacterium]|jgi:dihydropteroate synthase